MPFCCTAFDDKAKECERRREIAVQRVSLGGGSSPVRFTMAANTKVSGDGVRRLTFVVSKCVTSGALRMKNVHIHAATAGDCQPRQETVKSCLDAGLAKPLAECTCESYSRAVNLDSSSFGKCVGRSRTRCQMFAGSVSTAISGTTRPNVVPDTASTATMQTVVPATPMPRAASTFPSTSCGCSGSKRIEIHRDEYSSPDCSDGINSQSRVTIDAKGVRGTRSYNQLDVDWTNIKGDVLVSGKPERQTGTM